MADIKNNLGEDSAKLEPVYENMVMDIEPARVENMVVMEPENEDMVNIILVEAGPRDNEMTENENHEFKTNISDEIKLQEHPEKS